MSYAVVSDMLAKYGVEELEMVAPGQAPGSLSTDKITDALSDAESEINSYLAQTYEVPVEAPPESIKSACCDIARYRLFAHQATDEINQRYKDRIAWLKSISKGEATLGIADKASKTPVKAVIVTGGKNRLFTRDTLSDF